MFYHWHSDALKQYASGWIIVSAADVEAARAAARAAAEEHFWDDTWRSRSRDDEDDREDFVKFSALIEADIGDEPEHSATLFILGSE